MGAGTGAKTIVEPESLSWQTVFERVEAEFRLEVTAQEDLREELLFLEKGRNYLDLRSVEGSSIGIESTSSTDPLADQLLPSKEGVGDGMLVTLQNGDHVESSMGTGQHDFVRKRSDSSGVHVGCKGQSYVRRSRFRSNRYGNGHISPKAMEKLLAGEDPPTMHDSLQECALSPRVQDMQDNVASFSNRCQIVSTNNQDLNGPDEVARKEQFEISGPCRVKEHEASKNMPSEEAPFELGMNSKNVSFSACVPLQHQLSGPEGKGISSCDINVVHSASVDPSNLDVLLCTGVRALNANQSALEMRKIGQKTLENLAASERSTIDSECASTENPSAVETLSVDANTNNGSLIISERIIGNQKPHLEEVPNVDAGPKPLAFSNSLSKGAEVLDAKKTKSDSAVFHNELFSKNYAEASKIDIQFSPGEIQVKLEENLSNDNLSAASGEASRLKDTNGIHKSVVQEAGPLQGYMQSAVMIQRSASRLPGRLSSTSSSTTNKYHGVFDPRQGEKNDKVSSEADKVIANKFSASRKEAHEDIFLENAEAIKVLHKHVAEWGRRKAVPESSRRRSHWDFVLEEMAWMANDFMQERLWKTAAAAQICSQASQEKCPLLHGETTLEKQQRMVSGGLAKCVMRYWQSADVMLRESWQNPQRLDCADSGGTSEAVPMDVDVSTIRVLGDNELNGNLKVPSALQDYALRFLRSSLNKDSTSKPIGPLTPERVSEANVLDNFLEKKIPKESLLYVVPQGAFELYRLSVENEWAVVEAEHEQIMQEQAAAFTEAEAQASIMGSGSGLSAFADEFRYLLCQSSTRTGLSGEAEELEFQYLSQDLDTSADTSALIAKKKRKQIPKASFKFLQDMPTVGSALATPDTCTSLPSLHVMGKRPLNSSFNPNNLSLGGIPTKRIRTAAVSSRHRANGGANTAISTAGMAEFGYRENRIARTFNSQQKDFLGLPDESGLARTSEADLSPKNSVLGVSCDGTYNVPKSKKKKKMKQHAGLALSSTVDGASNLYFAENATDSDSTWQQEAHQQHEQKEQIKRKSDQLLQISSNNSSSDAGFGSVMETPETPGSQGPAGQQSFKKMRVSKQGSDGNLDGVVTLAAAQANTLTTNKILRQNSARDRSRKSKAGKAPTLQASTQAGSGIPWSTVEDQAIVTLLHDLGPNWELVSDVLSMNSQVKGIFRKPKDCKERFKVLLERLSTDDGDSPDDFTSLQAHSSAFSGIPKSSARMLLQRLQGPVEEDSLKVHFEQILRIIQRDRARRRQAKNDSQEMLEILPGHVSHAIVVSQFNSSNLTGGCLTPLELCDRPSNGDISTNAFTMQPANMNGLGFPALLAAGSGLRPSSAGLPLLTGLQMGPTLSPSTTNMNAAIDAQRMAAAMRPLSAEEQWLRYTQMVAGRAMPPGTSPPGSFSLNSPHINDSALPVLPSRPMAMPRPGMQSMLPPGVSGMASTGLNGTLPSGGVVMPSTAGSLMAGSVVGQLNFMRQSREALQMIRSGQCTEEQRQMLMQELQHHAAQGNTQAVAALNSLNGNLPSAIVSSPNQGHMIQQQQPNMLAQQSQNPSQAYMTAVRMAKERQFQQQQQEQQKWIFQQQQLHQPNLIQPQQQHVGTQQLQMQTQPQQQQEVSTISPSALQQQPPQTFHVSDPQQHTIPQLQQPQTIGQVGQLSSQPKLSQQKSLQRYQQQLQQQFLPTKGPKGIERTGAMVLPSFPSQSGQSNLLAGHGISNQQISQSLQLPQQMQGQRMLSASGSVQLPHQASQVQLANTGQGVQTQGQALEHIQAAIPNAAAITAQPKELLLRPQYSTNQQQPQLHLPPSTLTNQPQPQPLHSSLLTPQQQSQAPPSIPMLPQSPPPHSPQYQLRRQNSQPQPPHRRLQHRQTSSNPGLQTGILMGKNSLQQPPVSSQVLSNSGPFPFQMETTVTGPSSTGVTAQGVPLSSAISSTTIGAPATTWKPGQGFSSMSAGVYNLTRSNSSSINQLSPTRPSQAGHHTVPTSAVNTQRSMVPGTIGSAPVSDPGSTSIQTPAVCTISDATVAASPTSSR